jgi:hypothetical protein
MVGTDARLTAKSASPSSEALAPVCDLIAGSEEAHAPHHRPNPPNAAASRALELEITVDEVVFLQATQAFADLARADRANAGNSLEIALRGPDD